MATLQKITPNLWFDDQAEDAAKFYISLFKQSKITKIARFSEVGFEFHHRPAGSVMTIEFEIAGQQFVALNGGPIFKFNEAVSFIINCETQEEIDYYWEKLSEGGDKNAQQCGWLKDKFGLSWQVVPTKLSEMMVSGEQEKIDRMLNAMFQMKKLVISKLESAYHGRDYL